MTPNGLQQPDQTNDLVQRFRQKPCRRCLGLEILE